MQSSSVRHYCGLMGVYGHEDAVRLTHVGLHALQHRGQEGAGIVSTNGDVLRRHAGLGLVSQVFNEAILERLRGRVAIGHARYSTSGGTTEVNTQPLLASFAGGQVAIAHNGNLINATLLRRRYEQLGHVFQTTSDTEVIFHLIADPENQAHWCQLDRVLYRLQGAYSLVVLFRDRMVAVRDPLGFRPLCLGVLDGAHVVASETCALDMIDATYVRDLERGEMVTITDEGVSSRRFGGDMQSRGAACIFEQIYFANPSSRIFGENVHAVRVAMGSRLAQEGPRLAADLVVPIPTAGQCAAIGYARESRIPYGRAFTTSHYSGRSFILPTQAGRDLAVKLKLNVIKEAVAGKRLIVVEDSIVRGTTTRGKIGRLREAGAKEVHLRVASPPIRHPCYFGIDFPDPKELVTYGRSVEDIRAFLGVDSLYYLSQEGMLACVKMAPSMYCTACFSGDYPMNVEEPVDKFAMEPGQLRMFT